MDTHTVANLMLHRLLESDEPSIRYKALTGILGCPPGSAEAKAAREDIRSSSRVERLLSERGPDGRIPLGPYSKWMGAHWVLAALADIGYPPGDAGLIPLREQVLEWLLGERHARSIKTIAGRVRRCASQEGNALYAMLSLGLADERAEELARRLRMWQWPDGGWNCDKKREAVHSSFWESLIPLRALGLHARLTGNEGSRAAARCAAEVFLKRGLFRRQQDGQVMREEFLQLHYPAYWRYDILAALRVMVEAGVIHDPRCGEALDLLEAKRLPDGGFAAEGKFYVTAASAKTSRSTVGWGDTKAGRMNEFITVEALSVLQAAGRLAVAA
ncbi:MAG TPA: hypothetical protein VMJ64_17065 [Anaerolineales bacterium]|nr:hypothetical protein [Anaerolineales bacterium]